MIDPHGRHGFPHPPMPPPPPGTPGMEAGPRVRRGDVRAALLLLLGEEPKNGYQMIQDIEARSRGVWRPSPGSVYPALQQLEDECLVTGGEAGGSRTYRLTEEGRDEAGRLSAAPAPWDEVASTVPEDRHELRLLWGQLGEAFVHLTRTANDRQVAEAKKLLRQTRKSVFQILAED
ncbi:MULTISPECIES: PadR family transcriptional regulator [Nonomuraea]|uniref:PadR family transcriptional regulator n=2 Tax=Nonomuraea TaxID=83681 RepID=A0ABT4T8E6_9ACTN|nr:helix-turn-helix transcriptional regulator [Nonomuraea ferruginea]MDA0645393.1 PadR family transcriptional regulator [Nonomuraea ferruginea]TXK39742.1 helix-turn-helix transcriptional regulator [Nonomuraea sp. C10]